jgi:hypothetical protein
MKKKQYTYKELEETYCMVHGINRAGMVFESHQKRFAGWIEFAKLLNIYKR